MLLLYSGHSFYSGLFHPSTVSNVIKQQNGRKEKTTIETTAKFRQRLQWPPAIYATICVATRGFCAAIRIIKNYLLL